MLSVKSTPPHRDPVAARKRCDGFATLSVPLVGSSSETGTSTPAGVYNKATALNSIDSGLFPICYIPFSNDDGRVWKG